MFTEKEFDKIVEAWESAITFSESIKEVIREVSSLRGVVDADVMSKVISLANPDSREWAKDKYVKKEKKYLWTTKINQNGTIIEKSFNKMNGRLYFDSDNATPLSKSEIENTFGIIFDLDYFDKEEV